MCRSYTHQHKDTAKIRSIEGDGDAEGQVSDDLFDRHPEWKRKTGRDKTFWARGYYVSTVGINESVIRQYIKNQENADRIADGC